MEDLSDEDRCRALLDLREILSSPDAKYTAVMQELLFTCTDLTNSTCFCACKQDKPNDLSDEVMLTTATRLLGDADEEVVAAGCRIFVNLTVSNEGCLLLAANSEVVSSLAAMLTSQPLSKVLPRVVELLMEVLANLTRVYEGARACAQFPIIAPVLSLLKKPRLWSAETLLHVALILTNAATYDEGKREAIQLEAVEICLKVLTKVLHGELRCDPPSRCNELTRCLVGAVMGLSTSEDAKPRVIEFGIEPLAVCLTHASSSVRQNAAIAINSACDLARGVVPFTQRLLHAPELLVDVLGIKAVSALNKNVCSFDDEETPAALKALAALFESDATGTADRIVQTLDMLDNLIQLLGDGNTPSEAQQDVEQVLKRMSEAGPSFRKRVGKCMAKHDVPASQFALILSLTLSEFQEQSV
ncbi:hypothetical protein BBJ28_00013796 [Nothophytophthora sp. Chile5]|nr:hypothetical protein BBJ28_00013796 [Nothophytophthora sp. Chile5]